MWLISTICVLMTIDVLQANAIETWKGKWFPHAPQVNETDNWKGKWFPHPPSANIEEIHIKNGTNVPISMSLIPSSCDNAKDGLSIDFDPSNSTQQSVYLCFENQTDFHPNRTVQPILREYMIPPAYSALHRCMNETISYDQSIPTFGPHRVIWPKYGDYTYIPPQRWVHSLEHGAIVALYHPCANRQEVLKLKKLIKQCLYRHIVSPSQQLSAERPFALIAWGKSLEFSFVDVEVIIAFIRMNALQGPEQLDTNGAYDQMIIDPAVTVSTKDSSLCPNM